MAEKKRFVNYEGINSDVKIGKVIFINDGII